MYYTNSRSPGKKVHTKCLEIDGVLCMKLMNKEFANCVEKQEESARIENARLHDPGRMHLIFLSLSRRC